MNYKRNGDPPCPLQNREMDMLADRSTDIVAYKGNVFNQKESPRVNWNIGRLHAKNLEP